MVQYLVSSARKTKHILQVSTKETLPVCVTSTKLLYQSTSYKEAGMVSKLHTNIVLLKKLLIIFRSDREVFTPQLRMAMKHDVHDGKEIVRTFRYQNLYQKRGKNRFKLKKQFCGSKGSEVVRRTLLRIYRRIHRITKLMARELN